MFFYAVNGSLFGFALVLFIAQAQLRREAGVVLQDCNRILRRANELAERKTTLGKNYNVVTTVETGKGWVPQEYPYFTRWSELRGNE